MNICSTSLHVTPTMAFTWDLQPTPRGFRVSVWPKVCFYNIPPENLQWETTQWLEYNLIFAPCETSLEWHSYTCAPGKTGHIWLVVLAFTALAPALQCSSSHLHVAMRPAPSACTNTPHLCNSAKQLPCAWSKHVQSNFGQCSPRLISSDINAPWYWSIKKLSKKIRHGIVSSLVMSKAMPRNSCLCTRLPLHKAVMSLAAAQNCSWAMWETSSASKGLVIPADTAITLSNTSVWLIL